MGEGLISVQFLFCFIFLSSCYPPLCLVLLPKGLSDTYSLLAGSLQLGVGSCDEYGKAFWACYLGNLAGWVSLPFWLFYWCSSSFSLSLRSHLPIWNFFPTSKSHHLVLCWIFSVDLHSHILWNSLLRVNTGTALLKPSGILGFKFGLLTVSQSKGCGVGV